MVLKMQFFFIHIFLRHETKQFIHYNSEDITEKREAYLDSLKQRKLKLTVEWFKLLISPFLKSYIKALIST